MLSTVALMAAAPPGRMERVRITEDGKGFVLEASGKRFTPWGLNYGNAGRLIEDFWDRDWETVARDFHEMKGLGANLIRVHLQFGKFMDRPDRPNGRALQQLSKLLDLAEKTRVYLDLTGLGCYRKADIPDWYDVLSEEDRWAAQACFWGAVA